MRDKVRFEGTPFTRRRIVSRRTETPAELLEGLRSMTQTLQNPWEQQRPLLEWIDSALEQEKAARPGYQFKAREDNGWYLEQMQMHARIVDDHIAKGSASWAANHGALFGELWAEFQLRVREDLYCRALDHQERRRTSASLSPGTHESRCARVQHYLDCGDKLMEAYRNAAVDLGIALSTVRRSWAISRKGAACSG